MILFVFIFTFFLISPHGSLVQSEQISFRKAVEQGDFEQVKTLFQKHKNIIDINEKDKHTKQTFLTLALVKSGENLAQYEEIVHYKKALQRYKKIIRFLLEQESINIEITDHFEWTPFMWVAYLGDDYIDVLEIFF